MSESHDGLTPFRRLHRFKEGSSPPQEPTDMSRMGAFLALSLALAGASRAQSLGSLAEVSIIDRDSGVVLSPHYYRGEYWVAGRPGAKYAIQVHNRLGERLLAVTSVDGVNVLSGATAGFDQAGYVFSSGERYEIAGWRKSDAEIAAFTFTESPSSYAERTGRPANVGVIGVALFRERRPPSVWVSPRPPLPSEAPMARERESAARAPSSAALGSAPASANQAPPAPPANVPADKAASIRGGSASASPAPRAKLGTGHGEREYSYVDHTEFARLQPQPNEIIRIRYDSLENLLAMGIVKRPQPPTMNPFPASPEQPYVPDPPG
jgi:hypothetical protein